jgi:hypothetical protein
MLFLSQLGQTVQTEYGLAYALTFGLIFLGLLSICVPRPRKSVVQDETQKTGKMHAQRKK